MTHSDQLTLIGFENAAAINMLLERVGVTTDLGVFLSHHLLAVLRRQYSDLDIESIELTDVYNCTVDGIPTSDVKIINIETLSLPMDANLVVAAQKKRYSLRLHILLNAKRVGDRYDLESDVIVRGQTFLGAG